jgi:hypothetical protein
MVRAECLVLGALGLRCLLFIQEGDAEWEVGSVTIYTSGEYVQAGV